MSMNHLISIYLLSYTQRTIVLQSSCPQTLDVLGLHEVRESITILSHSFHSCKLSPCLIDLLRHVGLCTKITRSKTDISKIDGKRMRWIFYRHPILTPHGKKEVMSNYGCIYYLWNRDRRLNGWLEDWTMNHPPTSHQPQKHNTTKPPHVTTDFFLISQRTRT